MGGGEEKRMSGMGGLDVRFGVRERRGRKEKEKRGKEKESSKCGFDVMSMLVDFLERHVYAYILFCLSPARRRGDIKDYQLFKRHDDSYQI